MTNLAISILLSAMLMSSTAGAARIGLFRVAAPEEEILAVHEHHESHHHQRQLIVPPVAHANMHYHRSLFDEDADLAFRQLFTVGGGRGGGSPSLSLSLSFSMPQFSLSFSMPNSLQFGDMFAEDNDLLLPQPGPTPDVSSMQVEDQTLYVEEGKGFMDFESYASMAGSVIWIAAAVSVVVALIVRKRRVHARAAAAAKNAPVLGGPVADESIQDVEL